MKKFYVASKLENLDAVAHLIHVLSPNYSVTYDWTKHGSVQKDGIERIREVSMREVQGVQEADFVVVLLPGGRGTHVELGIALGTKTPVFIYAETDEFFMSDERTCAFYHHPLVTLARGSILNLVHEILAWDANQ